MPTANATFPPEPAAVARVRSWAREQLDGWAISRDPLDNTVLLASELATNAVIHAATPFEVTITYDLGVVRVAVIDHIERLPELQHAAPTATSGRGIKLVQDLSSGWGAEAVAGNGKVVWFELPT